MSGIPEGEPTPDLFVLGASLRPSSFWRRIHFYVGPLAQIVVARWTIPHELVHVVPRALGIPDSGLLPLM